MLSSLKILSSHQSRATEIAEVPRPTLSFEITVDRWDEAAKKWSNSKHCTYKTKIEQVELSPGAVPYAQLEQLLIPHSKKQTNALIAKAQYKQLHSGHSHSHGETCNSTPTEKSELFSRSKVGHFDDYRSFKSKLYKLYTKTKDGDGDGAGGGTDETTLASMMDDATFAHDLPSALDTLLPKFPPTLFKRKLGLSLSEEEHRTRVVMLEEWMRAVVLALPTFPRQCQTLVAKFLNLNYLGELGFEQGLQAETQALAPVPESSHANSADHDAVAARIRAQADALLQEGHIDNREHALMVQPLNPPIKAPVTGDDSSVKTGDIEKGRKQLSVKLVASAKVLSSFVKTKMVAAARRASGLPPPIPEEGRQGAVNSEGGEEDDTASVASGVSELSCASDLRGLQAAGIARSINGAGPRPKSWLDDTDERPLCLHGGSCGPLPVMVRVFRYEMVAKSDGGSRRHVGYRLALRLQGAYLPSDGDDDSRISEGEFEGDGEVDEGSEEDMLGNRDRETNNSADGRHLSSLQEVEAGRLAPFEGYRQLSERLTALGVTIPGSESGGMPAAFPKSQSTLTALKGGLSESELRERCRQLHNWVICLLHALPTLPATAQEAVLDWLSLDLHDPQVALSVPRTVMHFSLLAKPVPATVVSQLGPVTQYLLQHPIDPAIDIQRPVSDGGNEMSADAVRAWTLRQQSACSLTPEDMGAWGSFAAWSHISVSLQLLSQTQTQAQTQFKVQGPTLQVVLQCGPRPGDWEHHNPRFRRYDAPRFSLPGAPDEQPNLPPLLLRRTLAELCDLRAALEELLPPLHRVSGPGTWTGLPGMQNAPFPNVSGLMGGKAQARTEAELCVAEMTRWLQALTRNAFRLLPESRKFVDNFFFGGSSQTLDGGGVAAPYYRSLILFQQGGPWVLLPPRALKAADIAAEAASANPALAVNGKGKSVSDRAAADAAVVRERIANPCCTIM